MRVCPAYYVDMQTFTTEFSAAGWISASTALQFQLRADFRNRHLSFMPKVARTNLRDKVKAIRELQKAVGYNIKKFRQTGSHI